ncbi:MAG: hypothetical protein CM1200mP2_16470 [Planctomycetaceae bacterium]|nr:MAG: hypothetical protein CM1200mP2_16470 [Planctomycetaceae bacterium]
MAFRSGPFVVSTDNFGLLGERPTHPGLLDWLSVRLIRDGGAIKVCIA